jgi:hypothetical protein
VLFHYFSLRDLSVPTSLQYKDLTAKHSSVFSFIYLFYLPLVMHKLKNVATYAPTPKRGKKVMHLGEKLKELDKLTTGEHASAVGQNSGINLQ